MSQREASLKEKLDEKESEISKSGSRGKEEAKPRSLRSRLMKRLAEEESNSAKRFRNAGSLASDDVTGKSQERSKVQTAMISSKNVSIKTGTSHSPRNAKKDSQKPALKEKHSTATLKNHKPTLLSKSSRTGGADTLGTGSGNLKASKVNMNSRLANKKGSATVRINKVPSFNVP